MKTSKKAGLTAILIFLTAPAWPQERHNWFNDPVLQLSADHPTCPAPDGPLLTEAQMREQAHDRIERGNSCYLSQKCSHASAYAYDKEIAQAARQRLQHDAKLKGSTLWLTVQRRFITLEGCARSRQQVEEIHRVLSKLPNVQHVNTDAVSTRHGS